MTRPLQDYVDTFKSVLDSKPTRKFEPMLAFFFGLTAAYALIASARSPAEVRQAMAELEERYDRMKHEFKKRGMTPPSREKET